VVKRRVVRCLWQKPIGDGEHSGDSLLDLIQILFLDFRLISLALLLQALLQDVMGRPVVRVGGNGLAQPALGLGQLIGLVGELSAGRKRRWQIWVSSQHLVYKLNALAELTQRVPRKREPYHDLRVVWLAAAQQF
jgi:hypothetical protein